MSEFFGIRAMRFVACAVVGMAVGLGVVQGQTISAGSTDELKRLARPFATVEAVDDSRDLVAWKELVSKARVVSLGESKHGAHEWLALRNRLFYFLVKECGFTAIALETGFPEARRISDYVLGGPGEAEQVVRAGMTWGFGAFAENVELVKWIRKYNENPANARKVRLYGIDLSLGGPMGSVPTAAAIEQTLEYLDRVDKMSALGLRKRLGPHVAKLPHGQLTAAEHDELTIAIGEMVEVVEREAPEYLQRSTKAEYGLARQSAAVARQGDRVHRALIGLKPEGGIPKGAWKTMSARDAAMAENVLWALGQESKLFVFAHNAHVKNAPTEGGHLSGLERPPSAMGSYLRAALGKDLVIVGASFGKSDDENGVDARLAGVGIPQFVVDLRKARTEALRKWLATTQRLRSNDDSFFMLKPGIAFDALVFVDPLSPSR